MISCDIFAGLSTVVGEKISESSVSWGALPMAIRLSLIKVGAALF